MVFAASPRAHRLRWKAACWLLVGGLVCSAAGCGRGELRLREDLAAAGEAPTGGGGGDQGAGGSGADCEGQDCGSDPPCESSGSAWCSGGSGAGPCEPGEFDCLRCVEHSDCPTNLPVCDVEGECRQCIESAQCLGLFGGEKPVCWDGYCTPCHEDFDCPWGLTCDEGRCGQCSADRRCPEALVCEQGSCRIVDP